MVRSRSNIIPEWIQLYLESFIDFPTTVPVRGANIISCYDIKTWSRASKQEVFFDKDLQLLSGMLQQAIINRYMYLYYLDIYISTGLLT